MMNEEIAMSIRTTMIQLLAVTASAWALSGAAHAEYGSGLAGDRFRQVSSDDRQRLQGDWRSLSAEQQAEKRREIGEKLAAMTPEQRQQMRQQMRDHWQQMPPEERRQFREQRQQQREEQYIQREERQQFRQERPIQGNGGGWHGRQR